MKVAAVDIGSNSVRLLVCDGEGRTLHRATTVTGLASGVDATGTLSNEAVDATMRVIEAYRDVIEALDVGAVRAVATSATRDADNGPSVMSTIGGVLGSPPEIISGEREASLAFAGATSGRSGTGPRVVADIGGGSTEIIRGDRHVDWVHSYDIGSVRLTDRSLPNRPATREELSAARAEVDRVFSTPPVAARSDRIIGVAGTFTSLAAMHLDLVEYDADLVHGSAMSRDDIGALLDHLATLDVPTTARIPSLQPARAPAILAGTVVAAGVMDAIGASMVEVSESDLLDGVCAELLAG